MLHSAGRKYRHHVPINVFLTFTLSQFGMVPLEGPRDGQAVEWMR
jgi:hypothetical protein